MNNDRNQGRAVKPQAEQKHPDEWQRDLNPNHLAGQNIGSASDDNTVPPAVTAFHLRKRGVDVGPLDDEELKQVPVLPPGERLQQGATYVDLTHQPTVEFTARADMTTRPGDAYV